MSQFLPVIVNALGWALLHFLWQGVLIAILLALSLSVVGKSYLTVRYALSYGALWACLAAPVREIYIRLSDSYAGKIMLPLSLDAGQAGWGAPELLTISGWLQLHMGHIVFFWLACVVLLALRMCAGLFWINGYGHHKSGATNVTWQLFVDRLSRQFNISCKVTIRIADDLTSPITVGVLRPMILLPASMLSGMPVDLLEMLIAHEMAHIRRHDYLLNLLQSVIEMLLFYHPAVWWISKQIRNEREEIADQLAARVTGEPRRLALALSELANYQFITPQLAQAAHGGNLMSRIKRLVKPEAKTINWKAAVVILGLASSSLALIAHANVSPADDQVIAKILYRDDDQKGDKRPVVDFNKCKPTYPSKSLQNEETGTAFISALVDAKGKIIKTKVDRSTGFPDLDNAVTNALENCHAGAVPGTIDGKSATIWTKVQYVWKLK